MALLKVFYRLKRTPLPIQRIYAAVTRIRTWVTSATTKGTNHYTITATGIDKITISFLRSLFSAPYILVSTPSILYHKREVEVRVGGPTLTVPLKVCVGRGGGSKGH